MVALSRFLSANSDKGYPYFQCLKKNDRFTWTQECEEAFTKLKEYLAMSPILRKSAQRLQIRLYFIIKVLQDAETRYLAIEKAVFAVVFTARRLRHYFQSFTVIIMTDLPIRKVLQKLDIVGRMV